MDSVGPVLEGWSQGELRVQRCHACGSIQFPPRAVCLRCRAERLEWATLPPRATIVSFTVVHRAPTPAWKAQVPYAIVLIDLAPGVRMMMNLPAENMDRLAIGAPVHIGFTTAADGQRRPEARLV